MRPRLILLLFALLLVPARLALAQGTAHFTILLPSADTELKLQGAVRAGTGTTRELDSPPLAPGQSVDYTFVAEWAPSNYEITTRTQTVAARAGDRVTVDMTRVQPNDRMRIRYVATPDELVTMMVELAKVTPNDVVFEPGCGDARLTIEAVKAGAKRGVGIDIDAGLVARARESVRAQGLQDKVEIRQGDALDIKDLAQADVVFLYMSDEFDLLLRPALWRELKVGSRIVSHRFLMGDWTPDQTYNVTLGDGFPFTVHVWTVTPQVKARVGR